MVQTVQSCKIRSQPVVHTVHSCKDCMYIFLRVGQSNPPRIQPTAGTEYLTPEMRYCEISKEMSLLYFGLAVLCPFEARDPEFDKQPLPPPPLLFKHNTEHCVKFWDSCFKLAEYIKPKRQPRHLFADLRILCLTPSSNWSNF